MQESSLNGKDPVESILQPSGVREPHPTLGTEPEREDYAVEILGVSKYFKRQVFSRQYLTLKTALLKGDLFDLLKPREVLTALKDVTIRVPRGTVLGVIGPNGSGKSTLLKLIAGITQPSEGSVTVRGRLSALIELGAGFHPELTGRENIYINAIMIGLTKQEIREKMEAIIHFAELEDFIDTPVRTYSSGMFMRLGFSVAVHVDPEILLIDEVLAVGDEAFAHKCLERMLAFRAAKKTIILVTHALGMVEEFCDVALWLGKGKVNKIGDPREVAGLYRMDVARSETRRLEAKDQQALEEADVLSTEEEVREATTALEQAVVEVADEDPMAPKRWGDQRVTIETVRFFDDCGKASQSLRCGSAVRLEVTIRAREDIRDFVFGFGLYTPAGVHIYGTNTDIERMKSRFLPRGTHRLTIRFNPLNLLEGRYYLDLAIHRVDGYPYDYHHGMHSFRVYSETPEVGIVRPQHTWMFSDGIRFLQSDDDEPCIET